MERGDRSSILGIVVGNAITIVIAVWQGWSPLLMLWPYWFQSVAIGWYNGRRMMALEEFSTEGFKSNGKQIPATADGKRMAVIFFALHYGFFHLIYFGGLAIFTVFAVTGGESGAAILAPATALDLLLTWLLGAMFFWSHRKAYREQLAADLTGKPNLGTMMFLPYLRVMPMHLMIILGAMFGSAGLGVIIFGAMKTLADVAMHVVEHWVLRRKPRAAAAS